MARMARPTGAVDDEEEPHQERGGDQGDEQAEAGDEEPAPGQGPGEQRGHRKGLGPAPGEDQGQVLQQERGGDGGNQQRNPGGPAQGPVGAPLQQHPHEAGEPDGQAESRRPGPGEQPHPHDRHVSRHHQQVAVGKIDQPQDAVHQGVADGDEGVETAQRQAVDELLEEGEEIHGGIILKNAPGTREKGKEKLRLLRSRREAPHGVGPLVKIENVQDGPGPPFPVINGCVRRTLIRQTDQNRYVGRALPAALLSSWCVKRTLRHLFPAGSYAKSATSLDRAHKTID